MGIPWSIVIAHDSIADSVSVFSTKDDAMNFFNAHPTESTFLVRGTQLDEDDLGIVEESDRIQPFWEL